MYYTWHCYQGVLCPCCSCCYLELKYFNTSIYAVDIKSAAAGGTADSQIISESQPDKPNSQLGKPDIQIDKPESQPDKPDSQGSRDSQGSLKSQTSPRKPKVSACCFRLQGCKSACVGYANSRFLLANQPNIKKSSIKVYRW